MNRLEIVKWIAENVEKILDRFWVIKEGFLVFYFKMYKKLFKINNFKYIKILKITCSESSFLDIYLFINCENYDI